MVTKVCRYCGSENVLADAYAQWNKEDQEWEVRTVYDKGHYCDDCDGETSIKDKIIEDETIT
jgi:hypothetical protein